ncbi:DUF499 domain-containing protein [Sphingobium cupriresistens]|uniref:ATPase n=1 Tax=Sphingobium cupriresistens LL01 TaxID=1420583 RepID=A0A0J7Y1F0_9SPHN|nr:DUF499 domain-containing protein [Sphingobium cupriresistens]KMS57562.1 ATPase [Sphingobium cupriresistens LL01]
MATNHTRTATQRVRDALDHLPTALSPFVEGWMKKKHGADWRKASSRAGGGDPDGPLDAYGLLKTILDNWRFTFEDAFQHRDRHRIRNFVSTAFDARNATAHLTLPLQDSDVLRYLDSIHELLKAVKAPEADTAAIKALYDEQRVSGVAVAPPPPPTAPQLDLDADGGSKKALKPWIEVALPHADVLANRFKESEFAADLFAVDAGLATDEYTQPESFYRITFLTEGLKRVLTTALQRLGDVGGDPVIGLQTAFGGGKTHTMLAAYHLASADNLDLLDGVGELAETAGVTNWKRPKVAVFVGSSKGTDASLVMKDGPKVHTLWGYLAWRLAGDAGLALVAESEAAKTNPGSEIMVEVLKLAGPSLILLDELVAYARQLPDDRFEAFLSFIQSLTEAAKMVPGALIIGSLPESDLEAGGEKGALALRRLQTVFGRVHSPWLPASGDETYEIIRRRLFQPLDADGEKSRDETVKAFHDLYKKNAAEFPPEAKEPRYLELLKLSYPIHPELFDRLSKDWASLEKFQRTRGVLRFMANVIGVLWHQQVRDPLITPARIPISHERVRASVLYPLDPAFGAVVDKEVDGDDSLAARMEARNPTRRISQSRAATRAARAVFICSAPLVGQPNAGLNGLGLRLACAEPGDQIAIFGEALRELSERATYLYEEAGRYWFSSSPTLNRLADERARALADYEVDADICAFLRQDAGSKGGFHKVFAAPDDPSTIDEAIALSLVILAPASPHSGRGVAKSVGTEAIGDALTRCRASQRRFRNTLMFVAPDEALLANARDVVRKAMAWESVVKDDRLQAQLTQAQSGDTKDKARKNRDAAGKAIRAAWNHILYPIQSDKPGTPFDLEHISVAARENVSIPASVYEKIKADGVAKEKLGTETLWLSLKPIWASERPHLLISEVAEWFASYVYLPKIKDKVVLELAIRDSVGKLDAAFGYADRYDESAQSYANLLWAKTPPEFMPNTAIIVREDVVRNELEKIAPVAERDGGGPQPEPSNSGDGPSGEQAVGGIAAPQSVKRFYGSVEIDMVRPIKALETIIEAVVMQLQHSSGAKVKLTLDVEATTDSGFSDADISVVRDNARQLKFNPESTGFE